MNTKTQKILRSFDIESSTKALVAKESKDVNSIARQHILKTLNIAQRLAARKLTWSPELHPEFPEDSRAYVFHLALCVHRACESRCSAAGIVPLNLWLSCVFPFVVPKRSRNGPNPRFIRFRLEKPLVITDIISSADASRREYSNRNGPVLESRFELRAAPTFCNVAGHGLSYARELRRTGKMAQSNGTTTSLIIQNNSSEFLPGSEFDQYVLQTYSLSSNGRVYTNLPNGLLAKALEELKLKPHIQYETIPHAHPKDYADVAKSHDVLAKNELLRLLHSASCDLILDGDKLISQEKASTKINAPTSLRAAFSALNLLKVTEFAHSVGYSI